MTENKIFEREINLIGVSSFEKLSKSSVMVCGLGGVGGAVVESLARAGIGKLILVDCDSVDITNINRQIIATLDTVGMRKTSAAKLRTESINPNCEIVCEDIFLTKDNIGELLEKHRVDFVADAIDNVSAKIALAVICGERGINLISSMGTGNKLDPSKFEISDIYKTSVCPLARVMRSELRKRNVKKLDVLYSKEEPKEIQCEDKRTPSSISFVPPCAGMMIAGHIIRKIIEK